MVNIVIIFFLFPSDNVQHEHQGLPPITHSQKEENQWQHEQYNYARTLLLPFENIGISTRLLPLPFGRYQMRASRDPNVVRNCGKRLLTEPKGGRRIGLEKCVETNTYESDSGIFVFLSRPTKYSISV